MIIRSIKDLEKRKINQEAAFQAARSIAQDEKDYVTAVSQYEEIQAKKLTEKEQAQEGSSDV